jgi:hypothetical protein
MLSLARVVGAVLLVSVSACSGDAFDSMNRDGGFGAEGGSMKVPRDGALPREASRQDERSSSVDGRGPPPARDSSIPDGDVPSELDGSSDAAPGDGAPPGWCEVSTATFCADFDRVVLPAGGWSDFQVTAGAALEFNRLDFTSPHRSLRSTVPSGTGLGTAASILKKTLSTTLGRSVLEFDCKVSSIATTPDAWLLQIARIGRNGPDNGVGIYAHSTGTWTLLVGAGPIVLAFELPAPPKYGHFVHVALDVVWSPTLGSAHLAFDGVSVLTKDGIVTTQEPATKTIELDVGLVDSNGATPASDVSFDNVVLEQH